MCPSIELIPSMSHKEGMIRIAHGTSFPFFVLKLKEAKKEESTVTLNVSSDIYKNLIERYDSDEVIIYIDVGRGKLGSWSPDMVFTFKTLNNIRVFPSSSDWVKAARKHISNLFIDETFEDIVEPTMVKERLRKIKSLLSYAGILSDLESREDLFSIARDVKNTNMKDSTSLIYRLAMTLFHSAPLTGKAAISQLEDSGVLYLNLMDNSGFKAEFPSIHTKLTKVIPEQRPALIKTFMAFVMGAYIYYKGTYNLGEEE